MWGWADEWSNNDDGCKEDEERREEMRTGVNSTRDLAYTIGLSLFTQAHLQFHGLLENKEKEEIVDTQPKHALTELNMQITN